MPKYYPGLRDILPDPLKKGDGEVHLRNNHINIAMIRTKQSTGIPTSFGKRTKKKHDDISLNVK
jgi:hypothetical protein